MAVDSTGHRFRKALNCFICGGNQISLECYTPTVGHMGEDVSIGSCIEPHKQVSALSILKGGRLYRIDPFGKSDPEGAPEKGDPRELPVKYGDHSESPVRFLEVQLYPSRHSYHYRGYLMPEFGDGVGKTIYVCKGCASVDVKELVLNLDEAYVRRVDKKVFNLFWSMVVEADWLETVKSRFFQSRWRKLGWAGKRRIADNLKTVLKEFSNANPKRAEALKLFRMMEKELKV